MFEWTGDALIDMEQVIGICYGESFINLSRAFTQCQGCFVISPIKCNVAQCHKCLGAINALGLWNALPEFFLIRSVFFSHRFLLLWGWSIGRSGKLPPVTDIAGLRVKGGANPGKPWFWGKRRVTQDYLRGLATPQRPPRRQWGPEAHPWAHRASLPYRQRT